MLVYGDGVAYTALGGCTSPAAIVTDSSDNVIVACATMLITYPAAATTTTVPTSYPFTGTNVCVQADPYCLCTCMCVCAYGM